MRALNTQAPDTPVVVVAEKQSAIHWAEEAPDCEVVAGRFASEGADPRPERCPRPKGAGRSDRGLDGLRLESRARPRGRCPRTMQFVLEEPGAHFARRVGEPGSATCPGVNCPWVPCARTTQPTIGRGAPEPVLPPGGSLPRALYEMKWRAPRRPAGGSGVQNCSRNRPSRHACRASGRASKGRDLRGVGPDGGPLRSSSGTWGTMAGVGRGYERSSLATLRPQSSRDVFVAMVLHWPNHSRSGCSSHPERLASVHHHVVGVAAHGEED